MNKEKQTRYIPCLETGVRNLDLLLRGGLPQGSVTLLAGHPGAGKTTLAQQICFHRATPEKPVVFFQTLSEPTAKTLSYMKQFTFFDAKKIENGSVHFVDLGGIMRSKGLEQAVSMIKENLKKFNPAMVVIDSFKVFEDLAVSREEFRKFSYEIAIYLMAWECTSFLIGEYGTKDIETNPLFSVVDGIITLTSERVMGDDQRFLQIFKMRGSNHYRDKHLLMITEDGVQIYAPRATICRDTVRDSTNGVVRSKIGIPGIDSLLGPGIPAGSSLLISGTAGTGKTALLLEAIYRGAKDFGQKGILFTFEETKERLMAVADGLGCDLTKLVKKGMVEILFVPQTDIMVEMHLQMMSDAIDKLKATRIAIDSMSVFMHKIKSPQAAREKVFQLTTLVQRVHGMGLFATDIPYGKSRISRFGVEETVVDGAVILSVGKDPSRQRYVEVYKLRNTSHQRGRHTMDITSNGIKVGAVKKADAKETKKLRGSEKHHGSGEVRA